MRLFVIILFLFPLSVYGNDSLRIITYPTYIHFYTLLGPSYSQVDIDNPELEDNLIFKPGEQSTFKLGFYYSWLGFGYSFLVPQDEEFNTKYGKTTKNDFEANILLPKFIIDLTLKNYKGFHLDNPEDYIGNWDEEKDIYPQIPNLRTRTISASVAYIFKPEKFSPGAAFAYTKFMRKSGGSWMIGGFAARNGIYSDSSIIPLSIKQLVDPKVDLKHVIFSEAGMSLGYSHLFVIRKKKFISFSLFPGLAYQRIVQQSSEDLSVYKKSALSMRTTIRFSLGHNGPKYFWGLETFVQSSIINNKTSELQLSSGHVEFFLGYRLNTQNWKFMKGVDKILHPGFLKFLTGNPPQRE